MKSIYCTHTHQLYLIETGKKKCIQVFRTFVLLSDIILVFCKLFRSHLLQLTILKSNLFLLSSRLLRTLHFPAMRPTICEHRLPVLVLVRTFHLLASTSLMRRRRKKKRVEVSYENPCEYTL